MRENIYDIFKAIRHFDVSAKEIDDIAKAYKFWINNPVDFMPNYRQVYYHKDILYAMPYPLKELDSAFIGIELNKVVYLAGYQCNVCQDKIAESLMWLKGKVFNKLTYIHYGIEAPNNLKLELPTGDEVKNLVKKTINDPALDCVVFNQLSGYWVTPIKALSEQTIATISWSDNVKYHCPHEKEEAHIQPVIRLRKCIDFIGHLNHFGVPDKETSKVYRELLMNIKKS